MRPTAEAGARDGASDAFGVVDVYTSVSTSEAAFTGRASSAALDGGSGRQDAEIFVRLGRNERTLALRSRHFLHAWEVR